MRTILIAVLFAAFQLPVFAQSSGSNKPVKETLKAQADQRRDHPDNVNTKKVIANEKDSSTKDQKKKKKCWFSKKKKNKTLPAKDALKDRNTKDPKLEKPVKQAEKANLPGSIQ